MSIDQLPPDLAEQHPWRRLWRYSRALFAPLLIWVLLIVALIQPVLNWLDSDTRYDEAAVQEWLEEARNSDATLADLVRTYVHRGIQFAELRQRKEAASTAAPAEEAELLSHFLTAQQRVAVKRAEIAQHLRALGEPPTKMYPGQLLLFPMIYRLEVHFDESAFPNCGDVTLPGGPALGDPVVWDSGLEPSSGQYRASVIPLGENARVKVSYQLRAWNKRQRDAQEKARRVRQLGLLAIAATVLGIAWLMLVQAGEREHQRQRLLARERVEQAERRRLELERQHAETQRQLLEQRLATQAAERQALELKSHLYASIGIMAGSYAHNIKNLLVRPNDLLRRCLERQDTGGESQRMLREVQQTLGTVQGRLQQILQTVRRDPTRSELKPLDLNGVVSTLARTWSELAQERWQLDLELDLADGPLWVDGDESHLTQAIENLLFNARDATFEMRNHHREAARRVQGPDALAKRQALIQAAAWRGKVYLRTRSEEDRVILEVSDNGAGMTEEVLSRCTETHFSTKRDDALYEGHSTGMGLGLSFVVAILDNHGAKLDIESQRLEGTTFRAIFPRKLVTR